MEKRRSRNQFWLWQMVLGSRSEPLSQLEVLVVDCQATAAAPRGHLLEIGWAQVRNTVTHPHACLIAIPDGEQIPPAISRITGISEHMMRAAVDRQLAWRALPDQAASLTLQPARARWILRSRGWRAAPQRRPRRSDGVHLARAGPSARDEGRVHVERAPRLARRTRRADPVSTAHLADAARRAAFSAACAWHLSHPSDRRQRAVCRQGGVAPSSRQ